jgi:hypothetical protein
LGAPNLFVTHGQEVNALLQHVINQTSKGRHSAFYKRGSGDAAYFLRQARHWLQHRTYLSLDPEEMMALLDHVFHKLQDFLELLNPMPDTAGGLGRQIQTAVNAHARNVRSIVATYQHMYGVRGALMGLDGDDECRAKLRAMSKGLMRFLDESEGGEVDAERLSTGARYARTWQAIGSCEILTENNVADML